ncbi:MAG: hypothetical protein OEY52_04135 [Gammaproteobacteria bacterium]|nr:hypothetical protein [Gammaproteobacteria bacterium]
MFGIELDELSTPPIAAITRLADCGESQSEWTLRCDPAYIHADMDRAVLMGHGGLGLSLEETEQLLRIVNAHVEQDGWQIEAHTVDRWYVKGAEKTDITTTAPHTILGQDIKHKLPNGPDASYWRSIMNELQMLLHDIPINLARQARGLLPVNSLWFWGGGHLPDKGYCPFDKVFTDDPVARGLAIYTGGELKATGEVWQEFEHAKGQHLLMVLDRLMAPDIMGDLFAWLDAVKQLEQSVIEKLIAMLKQKQLTEIYLLDGHGSRFTLTTKQLRHWWKRGKKFSSLLEKADH